MKLRSVPLILALAAIAAAPAAFAEDRSGDRLARLWVWVVEYLDGRAVIDPNGLDSGPCIDPWGGSCIDPNGLAAGPGGIGAGIDPNGFTSAGRPEGSGLDPHGGAARGFSIDPNGNDQGSAADPNG